MAQQAGSLQAFRAPLPPESLEGHGDKEGKARGKEQCGRNKSQVPGHHEQLLLEGRGGEGLGHLKGQPAVLAPGANQMIIGGKMIYREIGGCDVTACHCPFSFGMSLFLPLQHRVPATAER